MLQLDNWDEPMRRAAIRRSFKAADSRIIVLEGRDVGWTQVTERDADYNLAQIQILEEFCGLGIGSAILRDLLLRDAENPNSSHDFGNDLIPDIVAKGKAMAHRFDVSCVRDEGAPAYWKDVGTIDAYHDAHMDLVSVEPEFNLYNPDWPIWTMQEQAPGAKFVMRGSCDDTLVSAGCIISGTDIYRTVLGPRARIERWARVDESIIMNNVQIGSNATVHRAILDKNVIVPDGAQVGVDHDHDRARGFTVSPGGVTVVGKGITVPY